MGRRVVISVFGLMATASVLTVAEAVLDAASETTLRSWLQVGYATLKLAVVAAFTVLAARRGPARRRTREPLAYAACAAAMLGVVVLEQPDVSVATALVVSGELLAFVSVGWMLASTLALGRCFGVLPEARGLITHGPYSFVRHPLYLGEFGACAGLVIASPSGRNLVAAVLFTAGQAARMRMEERELTVQFPEYAAYAARTPRLVPRLLSTADGQALFEYAAILSIVSIVGIGALTVIGGIVNVDLQQIANAV
jgi:protein-S-isoprenylcysteine O-methyltransferase Ste14